ncbi:hypothetical protein AgCh_004124 [Apium graveolens]
MTGDRALLSNVVEKAGPLVIFGDNSKGLSGGYGCLQAGNVIIENLYIVLGTCCTLHLELDSSKMCTSVLLVGESKEEVNAPQFMDFAAADLLDYAISSSQSHFRCYERILIQKPYVSDSSDEFNKDGDLRTPIAPPVTSLRMAKANYHHMRLDNFSSFRSDFVSNVKKKHTSGSSEKETDVSNHKNIHSPASPFGPLSDLTASNEMRTNVSTSSIGILKKSRVAAPTTMSHRQSINTTRPRNDKVGVNNVTERNNVTNLVIDNTESRKHITEKNIVSKNSRSIDPVTLPIKEMMSRVPLFDIRNQKNTSSAFPGKSNRQFDISLGGVSCSRLFDDEYVDIDYENVDSAMNPVMMDGFVDLFFDDVAVGYATLGSPTECCAKCHAVMWKEEMVNKNVKHGLPKFNICCSQGQIKLAPNPPTPAYLMQLYSDRRKCERFRRNIRVYNAMFQFTSMGGKVDNSINHGRAPYVYRLNGQNHHIFGTLIPDEGEPPKFYQLYIYNTEHEVENMMRWVKVGDNQELDTEVIQGLIEMLDETNQLVKKFRYAHDQFEEQPVHDLRIKIKISHSESGRENHIGPSDEVDVVLVGDEETTVGVRDIIL